MANKLVWTKSKAAELLDIYRNGMDVDRIAKLFCCTQWKESEENVYLFDDDSILRTKNKCLVDGEK